MVCRVFHQAFRGLFISSAANSVPEDLYQTCADYQYGSNPLPHTKWFSSKYCRAANPHHGLYLQQDTESAWVDIAGTPLNPPHNRDQETSCNQHKPGCEIDQLAERWRLAKSSQGKQG